MEWAVGVTTAPRRDPTLHLCLESLFRAGWNGLRVFAEPDSEIPINYSTRIALTQRDQRLGAWPNWFLAITELYLRQPHADAYMMVQDDAWFACDVDLCAYLENTMWPAQPTGLLSLYCPSNYCTGKARGWYETNHGWSLTGALAFAFPRDSLKMLIADRQVIDHRLHGSHGGTRQIDAVVGRWAASAGLPVFHCVPSLVWHLGTTSTIHRRGRITAERQADRFAGAVPESCNSASQATSSERDASALRQVVQRRPDDHISKSASFSENHGGHLCIAKARRPPL